MRSAADDVGDWCRQRRPRCDQREQRDGVLEVVVPVLHSGQGTLQPVGGRAHYLGAGSGAFARSPKKNRWAGDAMAADFVSANA